MLFRLRSAQRACILPSFGVFSETLDNLLHVLSSPPVLAPRPGRERVEAERRYLSDGVVKRATHRRQLCGSEAITALSGRRPKA